MSRSNTQTQSNKRKRSVVWNVFERLPPGEDGEVKARCTLCEKLLNGKSTNGTNHLKNHMNNTCPNRPSLKSTPTAVFEFDQMKSRKDFAIAVMKHNYPFNMGEHVFFDIFLQGLNPGFNLPSRNTIRSDVIDVYSEERVKVYELLNELRCRVALTTDIWTSDHQNIAYGCLTAHFIDDDWELQKKILSFKNIPYPHNGETLFEFVKDEILTWNLDKKIFSVVVDNATSNDSMIKNLKNWFIQKKLIQFDGALLHVRCSAHILNLIVQDGLGQIRGLIEKIRETVRYVRYPAAAQRFATALSQCNLTDKRKVALDIPHRWNSKYELLETSLPLKDAFVRLEMIDRHYRFNPSDSEWEVGTHIFKCLQIFFEATRHFSGSKFPTSNLFFGDVCEIQLKMIEWKESELDFIRKMCAPMKEKFDKYWDECNLVLAVAVVFDPRFKMDLVVYYYSKIYGLSANDYVKRVRDVLDDLFVTYGGNCVPLVGQPNVTSSSGIGAHGSLNDFDRWCYESRAPVNQKSELETYLDEVRFPREEDFDILNWWKTNKFRLPTLARIARDILAVPATTVASEAAFSVGGRVIDESRASLAPDAVEALIAGADWICLPSIPPRPPVPLVPSESVASEIESSGTLEDSA